MKKIRLDLDALAVQSFSATSAAGGRAGTVFGRESYLTQFNCDTDENCPGTGDGCGGGNPGCSGGCDLLTRECSSQQEQQLR